MSQINGKAGVILPTASADGTFPALRTDEFGAVHARNELLAWAQEGSYFKACNATMGTGVAMGIQAAFSDTANVLFLMRNGSATKKIIPHYIRLINTAAGATTTSSHLAIVLDTANRYSTGGTDLTTNIVCATSGSGPTSAVDVLRYSCTGAAAVAKRQVARAMLKTAAAPCWVVGDEVRITFGEDADSSAFNATTPAKYPANVGPVVIAGQNHCMLVHMWNPANATTAPSWEFELAWWER